MSINGPPIAEANEIIESAAKLWLANKDRYKLTKHETSTTSTQTVPQGQDHSTEQHLQEPEQLQPGPEQPQPTNKLPQEYSVIYNDDPHFNTNV